MKRLIIICEGPTEQEFCRKTLQIHFINKNISIQYPLIKKSNGGIIDWRGVKSQIEIHLKQDPKAYLTTFIDYYGVNKKHNFPKWIEASKISDKSQRLDFIESCLFQAIDSKINFRFIPYLQLHEFESLLFNNMDSFVKQFPEEMLLNVNELENIINTYKNPEDINDHPKTAPSKRLKNHFENYKKVVFGNIIAEHIGLERIRNKSPRFNAWIETLEKI